ncbi:MAG: hypothetical protein AVDCRST_MAG26-3529, partial [uncultured Chloroflexia bacterium]
TCSSTRKTRKKACARLSKSDRRNIEGG